MINADNFKRDTNKLTELRIEGIVRYVIYCYLQMLSERKTYSYSEKGRIPKEEFLRNGLVNDYLEKHSNVEYFRQHLSDNPSVNITFHPEETMIYIDRSTNQQSTDKIDIAVCENILQSIWSGITENKIRFAIECKRIKKISDADNYVLDIDKFSNRNYIYTRLPFEGQIAFIEVQNINHSTLSLEINAILQKKRKTIATDCYLNQIDLSNRFNGTYLSKHRRNTSQEGFSIYHLLFPYSNVVTD